MDVGHVGQSGSHRTLAGVLVREPEPLSLCHLELGDEERIECGFVHRSLVFTSIRIEVARARR